MKAIQIQKEVSSPTLNTVLMVEDTLQNMDESVFSVADVKRKLPKHI